MDQPWRAVRTPKREVVAGYTTWNRTSVKVLPSHGETENGKTIQHPRRVAHGRMLQTIARRTVQVVSIRQWTCHFDLRPPGKIRWWSMAAGYTKGYTGYNNIQNNRRKRLQLAFVLVTMVLLRFRIFGKGNNLCIGYHQLANWSSSSLSASWKLYPVAESL